MFTIGDRVIYGSTGICDITEISTIDMEGVPKDKLYYILSPMGKCDSHIYAPVENCKVVMRKVLTEGEAQALIAGIPELAPLEGAGDKQREQLYRACIKSCDCSRLIQVIKTLWLRGRSRLEAGKKLSALDERYLKMAEEALYAELGLALGLQKDQVGPYISRRMEELLG